MAWNEKIYSGRIRILPKDREMIKLAVAAALNVPTVK